jgi:hypothetical protein
MSKASLIAMLVVGLAMVPTGLFMNYSLNTAIDDAIPEVLLAIQEGAEDQIEDELWIIANSDALETIVQEYAQDKLPPIVKATAAAGAINAVLHGLVDDALIGMNIINATTAAELINQTLEACVNSFGNTPYVAQAGFFNDTVFNETSHAGLLPIKGISEFIKSIYPTGDLQINTTLRNDLLYGTVSGLPGILEDRDMGMGMLGFMGLYANATDTDPDGYGNWFMGANRTDAVQQGMLTAGYNSYTFTNLTYLATYIKGYLWAQKTEPTILATKLMSSYAYAHVMARELFMNDEDWSTTTMGLAPFNGTSEVMTGGMLNLSYSSAAQFNLLNSSYLGIPGKYLPGALNDTSLGTGVIAIMAFYENATDGGPNYSPLGYMPNDPTEQATLVGAYGLDSWYQFANFSLFLKNYMILGIVPNALLSKYLTNDIPTVVNILVHKQWTNYELVGEALDLQLLEPELPESVYGLEVGDASITFDQFKQLFEIAEYADDSLSQMALVDRDGQKDWNEAYEEGKTSGKMVKELATEFGLTPTQSLNIANWLYDGDGCFQELALPGLFEFDQGMSIPDKAKEFFVEQWTEMTIDGEDTYPDGLPLGETAAGKDITGIELGVSSEIDLDTAADLWDEDNELSFTNTEDGGYDTWVAAGSNSAKFTELKEEFDLTNTQTRLIINWLAKFKSDVIPPLAEDQTGQNPALIRDILTYGLIIPGVIIALIGLIKLKKL